MKTIYENQLNYCGFSEERNLEDANSIYVIFKKINEMECIQNRSLINRFARETIQKIWQEPRLPKVKVNEGKSLRIKPFNFPWTPNAKQAYKDGNHLGNLNLEHSTPMEIIIERIKKSLIVADEELNKIVNSAEDMLDLLKLVHKGTSFIVVAAAEHRYLNTLKNCTNDDVWDRYLEGLKIERKDCVSLIEEGFLSIGGE